MSYEIPLRKRSYIGRLLRWPKLFYQHYTILRRYNGARESAVAAYKLSKVILG